MTSKLLQKFLNRSQITLTWPHNLWAFHRQFLPLSVPRHEWEKKKKNPQRTSSGNAGGTAIKSVDLPEKEQLVLFPGCWPCSHFPGQGRSNQDLPTQKIVSDLKPWPFQQVT